MFCKSQTCRALAEKPADKLEVNRSRKRRQLAFMNWVFARFAAVNWPWLHSLPEPAAAGRKAQGWLKDCIRFAKSPGATERSSKHTWQKAGECPEWAKCPFPTFLPRVT